MLTQTPTRAVNYPLERSTLPDNMATNAWRVGHSSRAASRKRSSSQTGVSLPPSKRFRSTSPAKATSKMLSNRVHDVSLSVTMESSSMRRALGWLCLLLLNHASRGTDACWRPAFWPEIFPSPICGLMKTVIILLDLTSLLTWTWPSKNKERASQEPGARQVQGHLWLSGLGEQHSSMHDLESFFWMFFWICVDYNARGDA